MTLIRTLGESTKKSKIYFWRPGRPVVPVFTFCGNENRKSKNEIGSRAIRDPNKVGSVIWYYKVHHLQRRNHLKWWNCPFPHVFIFFTVLRIAMLCPCEWSGNFFENASPYAIQTFYTPFYRHRRRKVLIFRPIGQKCLSNEIIDF